jgi:hypothetical protein
VIFPAPVGVVTEEWFPPESGLACLRLHWETEDNDVVAWLSRPLVGVLHKIIAHESTGEKPPYHVRLKSEAGWDVLNGLCVVANSVSGLADERNIYYLLDGSDRPRPIAVGGRLLFTLDGETSTSEGVFDIFYYPNVTYALESRVVF